MKLVTLYHDHNLVCVICFLFGGLIKQINDNVEKFEVFCFVTFLFGSVSNCVQY